MRHLLLAGAGMALAAYAFSSLPGLAEEKAPERAAPAVDSNGATGVEWVEGWAAGREKARHTERLMLVYVHRTSPP